MAERVIVVGGGLAGLTATCELLERGCNVTILEKEENLGGNSSKATCGIAVPGSALQAAAGVEDGGQDLASDGPAAKALVESGPTDVEWLTKVLGVDGDLVLRLTPGHEQTPRTVGTKTHFPGAVVTYAAIHVLKQVAAMKPDRLEIISSALVTNLLTTDGRVTGVAYAHEGKTTTLDGVVLIAAGGYAGDYTPGSILAQVAPDLLKLPTTNDGRASGDGIKLGASVGGGVEKLEQVELTPTAAVLPGMENALCKVVISDAICGAGGRLLNAQGQRFVDELASSRVRVQAMRQNAGPFRVAIAEADFEPVRWLCEFYAKKGVMRRFGSAAELAADMGVAAINVELAVGTGPIFAGTVTPALYSCQGGLTTGWRNSDAAKVMTPAGVAIEGLYAAGEASASPFTQQSKLWSVSGIPLLYCVYSGRLAGRAAASAAGGAAAPRDLRGLIISSLTAPALLAAETAAPEPAPVEAVAVAAEAEAEAPTEEDKPLDSMTTEELIAKIRELESRPAAPAAAVEEGPKGIPMEEVKKHNTKEDAWIVVNGDVIDVTKWIPLHPGGEQAITAYLGQDASDEWNMIHKAGTIEKNLVQEGGNGPVLKGKLGSAAAAAAAPGAPAASGLSMDDVAKHNKESDLWIVVNGKAYDVTKWVQVHPGGVQAITAYAGKDASDEWNMIHKPGTIEKNLFPANPSGPVDMGPVSGAAPTAVAAAPVDDELPPPEGNGGIPGIIGAVVYLAFNIVKMLLKTVFFTGNFKFTLDADRKGTIRSACFLLTFTIIHVLGNFVGMIKGPNEANGEGYFFDRISWTGGLGLVEKSPLSIVEEYLALALVLHVSVALKRSWDISLNYCIYTGRWNMLLSGLTVLFFLVVHLGDIRFSSEMKYTEIRAPKYFVSWPGLLEGRVFYETDESVPLVRVRDIYTREVELFKDLGTCLLYTACISVFWAHMLIGWKKLVPADAMQIPKDHVKSVTTLGWLAATAIASMYLSVVWFTYVAEPVQVPHVP